MLRKIAGLREKADKVVKIFYEFDGNADCTTARAQADAVQVVLVEKYNFPKLDI